MSSHVRFGFDELDILLYVNRSYDSPFFYKMYRLLNNFARMQERHSHFDSVGMIISDAMANVGRRTSMTADEKPRLANVLPVVESMPFNRGYYSLFYFRHQITRPQRQVFRPHVVDITFPSQSEVAHPHQTFSSSRSSVTQNLPKLNLTNFAEEDRKRLISGSFCDISTLEDRQIENTKKYYLVPKSSSQYDFHTKEFIDQMFEGNVSIAHPLTRHPISRKNLIPVTGFQLKKLGKKLQDELALQEESHQTPRLRR